MRELEIVRQDIMNYLLVVMKCYELRTTCWLLFDMCSLISLYCVLSNFKRVHDNDYREVMADFLTKNKCHNV
jgi:hypothetical protein